MAPATSTSFERFERGCNALATALVVFGGFCLVMACALTAVDAGIVPVPCRFEHLRGAVDGCQQDPHRTAKFGQTRRHVAREA